MRTKQLTLNDCAFDLHAEVGYRMRWILPFLLICPVFPLLIVAVSDVGTFPFPYREGLWIIAVTTSLWIASGAWRLRHPVFASARLIIGGPAEPQIDEKGICFPRLRWHESYSWSSVRVVEKLIDVEPGERDEYYVRIVLRGGIEIHVIDNSEWQRFEELDQLSSGILSKRCA